MVAGDLVKSRSELTAAMGRGASSLLVVAANTQDNQRNSEFIPDLKIDSSRRSTIRTVIVAGIAAALAAGATYLVWGHPQSISFYDATHIDTPSVVACDLLTAEEAAPYLDNDADWQPIKDADFVKVVDYSVRTRDSDGSLVVPTCGFTAGDLRTISIRVLRASRQWDDFVEAAEVNYDNSSEYDLMEPVSAQNSDFTITPLAINGELQMVASDGDTVVAVSSPSLSFAELLHVTRTTILPRIDAEL
jgi:hypothetical protein